MLEDADPAAVTLLLGGRARPLDRHAHWPATANPYLLINRSTAGGTGPVSRGYVQAAVRRLVSPRSACALTGSTPKPRPAVATRSSSPTCSVPATRPPSATAPSSARPAR
jgi:hypothetical protein